MLSGQAQLLLGEGFYDLWLATLILAFSSSLIMIHNYSKSRKTPIGRAALYTALSSLIWSISVSIYTFPAIEQVEFAIGTFFLAVGFLAGILTLLTAYERAKIQSILTPSGKDTHKSRILLALSISIIPITVIGILSTAINNQTLNSAMGNMSILTAVCLFLISACLIAPSYPKIPKKVTYYIAASVIAVGSIVLFGYFAVNYNTALDAFLPGGETTIETAKGFIFAGLGITLASKRGLKAWFAKILLAMGILFIIISDLVAELIFHPPFLANSIAISFVFIGIAQLWSALKTE